jgi:pimeloyl-ACP methyl ester carboxylesterase
MDNATLPKIQGFKSDERTVNGVRLHYWIGGDPNGTPVLLWHGFLGTSHSWHKLMPMLAAAGYSVLAPDMRGYGDSEKPSGTDGYDAQSLANDFRQLVRQCDFGNDRPVFLVAHDMGAHPALLWAADKPEEIAGLLYMEVPTMLEEFLAKTIVYTPEAMQKGSMWWWILPLAPGVPERLIVGKEREFLTWFYDGATYDPSSISETSIQETLRTFSGREGVLGSLGLYRAAFKTIEQTTPLKTKKIETPILALGGEKALGAKVAEMVKSVASSVTGQTVSKCGHFIPEERPEELLRLFTAFVQKVLND